MFVNTRNFGTNGRERLEHTVASTSFHCKISLAPSSIIGSTFVNLAKNWSQIEFLSFQSMVLETGYLNSACIHLRRPHTLLSDFLQISGRWRFWTTPSLPAKIMDHINDLASLVLGNKSFVLHLPVLYFFGGRPICPGAAAGAVWPFKILQYVAPLQAALQFSHGHFSTLFWPGQFCLSYVHNSQTASTSSSTPTLEET